MGRILAIDYGRKRTGIAVTDTLQIVANGLTTVPTHQLLTFLKQYVAKEPVERIVVGLPKQMNNEPSESMRYIKPFLAQLAKEMPQMPVEMYDERFTSVIAHRAMLDGGMKKTARRDKAIVDEISATIIINDIQKYHGKTMVVKYGGNAMINEELKNAVMNDLVTLTLLGVRVVLVHGGGPAINEMLKKVGVESHFANGLRVTDDATMEIVQQVLAGKVNKDLVAKLRGRGVGLCGMDGQMLRCTELDPQLGHVGEIVHVDATLIASLLDGGFIPVIATVGMDDLGQAYNVNADTAAAQIAIALKAEKLVSMTDIAGLLRDKDDESTLIPEVEVSEIEGYKSAGIIAGGMIPKIGGMADAIYQGVHEAVIIDGRVPHSILLELFSNRGSGTRFYRRSHRE